MKTIPFARSLLAGALFCVLTTSFLAPLGALAQPSGQTPPPPPASLETKIAAIKKAFADSQAALHTFQWIQTTTVFVNDAQKKVQVMRCYYGEEGELVKVPISESPSGNEQQFGLRGRIREMEKEQMSQYIADAHKVVQRYLPPNPALIDACKAAGNSQIRILQPGQRVAIDFHNYIQKGDLLSVEVDPSSNRVIGVSVVSTMGENADPITLNVTIGAFPNGIMYNEQSDLLAPAKSVHVRVQNAGFEPLNN
jgi:hypothetical protein